MESIKNMPVDARVWVYQNASEFSQAEIQAIKSEGEKFIADWSAHGAALKASFDVIYNRFIVIAVDEKQAMATGCSIDKSVQFVQKLEDQFKLNLFNRMQVAYRAGDVIAACSLAEFENLAKSNAVTPETIVFNNMVTTKAAFETEWEVPVKKSWQNRVFA